MVRARERRAAIRKLTNSLSSALLNLPKLIISPTLALLSVEKIHIDRTMVSTDPSLRKALLSLL